MEDAANSSKGTVTPFASMFPAGDARNAAKHVEIAIAEKEKEMDHLKQFIADNSNLINLVSKLPDQLHHDIMVPFGKVAFFPGRLVHTNEFMVLLGEGYHAERTAKQTVEILKRRGKALESQVQALKANMEDLKAEASFFDATASEAVEGLVEIREDYVEDSSSEIQSKSGGKKVMVEEDEYSRMMSRLDELEQEELAAEGADESDEDEQINNDESDKDEQTSVAETDSENDETYSEIRKPEKQTIAEYTTAEVLSNNYRHQLDITDMSNCTGLTVQSIPTDESSKGKSLIHNMQKSISAEKNFVLPEVKETFKAASSSRYEVPMQTTNSGSYSSKTFADSILERTDNIQRNSEQTMTSSQKHLQTSKPQDTGFDSSKAFTGSIVERADNIVTTSKDQAATSSQPSKPVSRFKMQRR